MAVTTKKTFSGHGSFSDILNYIRAYLKKRFGDTRDYEVVDGSSAEFRYGYTKNFHGNVQVSLQSDLTYSRGHHPPSTVHTLSVTLGNLKSMDEIEKGKEKSDELLQSLYSYITRPGAIGTR